VISSLRPLGTGRFAPSRSTHCVRAVRPRWNAACALLGPFSSCARPPGREKTPQRAARPASAAPLPLLGKKLRPGARVLLPLKPPPDVITLEQHPGLDLGQAAVSVDQVREDAVVPLPVQRPRAVPVLIDRSQLLRALRRPLRVLAQAALTPEVGHVLADRDQRLARAPHRVLTRGEVPHGPPVGPQRGELVLPRLLARLLDHAVYIRVQRVM
jgi:hypothetical protein